MVRRNLQTVSDERVLLATGHPRGHWFALLDAAGAQGWRHPAIAAFLRDQGVPGWWSQGITVAYEQERGLRLPGQRPDGTFDANISRTFRVPADALWPLLVDDAAREAWLGSGWVVARQTAGRSLRLTAPDGTSAVLGVEHPRARSGGAEGHTHHPDHPNHPDHTNHPDHANHPDPAAPAGAVRLAVQHAKLPDPETVERSKRLWSEALGRLADHLG